MIQWLAKLGRSQQRKVTLVWSQAVDLSPGAGYRPQPERRAGRADRAEELHLQALKLMKALKLIKRGSDSGFFALLQTGPGSVTPLKDHQWQRSTGRGAATSVLAKA